MIREGQREGQGPIRTVVWREAKRWESDSGEGRLRSTGEGEVKQKEEKTLEEDGGEADANAMKVNWQQGAKIKRKVCLQSRNN